MSKREQLRRGWLPDMERRCFYRGEIVYRNGIISTIRVLSDECVPFPSGERDWPVILPGLVDAHVHIESSMVIPSRFSSWVVRFGTVATVSDPHEIANVIGVEGVRFMVQDARNGRARIFFTAPSCVPATRFETAGAVLDADALEPLMADGSVIALGEMMNYPGVIFHDPNVMSKLEMAKKYGLPIDGHAPGVSGEDLIQYVSAGITTEHECTTLVEAEEKIAAGMKILIRECSVAPNFDALAPLIERYPDRVMLCSDDCHPDDLIHRHIDDLIRRGMQKQINIFNLIRAASHNPVEHYKLPIGLLRIGDSADFIVVSDLPNFRISETVIAGETVYSTAMPEAQLQPVKPINQFQADRIEPEDLRIDGPGGKFRVIQAIDGELKTKSIIMEIADREGEIRQDPTCDLLKIAVVNRYHAAKPSVGLIQGFKLKTGAIASSIAHDSHQIIVIGANDKDMCLAVNMLIENKGGISIVHGDEKHVMPLPFAGLMSGDQVELVAQQYVSLNHLAAELGSTLRAPFMTLSFMALLVIPSLKISDRGLFDSTGFRFTPLRVEEHGNTL